MKRVVIAAVILSVVGLGAPKNRSWETGKVLSYDTRTEYTEHNGEGEGHGLVTAMILTRTTSKTHTETLIAGKEYSFLIVDHQKHPCRFVVSDDVKYLQERAKLDVLDVDGKECKLDIVRQERLAPKP